MSHPVYLQLMMHADAALRATDAAVVEQHLAICASCRQTVIELQQESKLIETVLREDVDQLPADGAIPKFNRPAGLREFALANLLTALIIWLAGFLWKTIFGELVMNAVGWFTSLYAPDAYAVTNAALLYYIQEGTAMLDAYLGVIVVGITVVTVVALLLRYLKARQGMNLVFCTLLTAFFVCAIGFSEPTSALDLRHDGEVVTIAEGETVDDTLLVAAETVLIRGTVTGDLFVAGRRVDIDGVVEGNLVAFADAVTIRGSVGGLVLSAGSGVDILGASLGGDLWAAGENLSIDKPATITGNAILTAERAVIAGRVGKDLYSFTELVELSGVLGEDMEAFGARVRLLEGADIGGSARLRIESDDRLQRADGVTIAGELEILGQPESLNESSRYARAEFYLWQVARIVSAVLAGLILVWLIPPARSLAVNGGVAGLKTGGIGFLALIGIPVAAFLVAMTLIGLPFALFVIVCWMLIAYLGKIVVGIFIGRALLDGSPRADNWPVVLLAGMTIVIVAANLPWIGGVLSFVFTIVGMGLIVQRLYVALPMRNV